MLKALRCFLLFLAPATIASAESIVAAGYTYSYESVPNPELPGALLGELSIITGGQRIFSQQSIFSPGCGDQLDTIQNHEVGAMQGYVTFCGVSGKYVRIVAVKVSNDLLGGGIEDLFSFDLYETAGPFEVNEAGQTTISSVGSVIVEQLQPNGTKLNTFLFEFLFDYEISANNGSGLSIRPIAQGSETFAYSQDIAPGRAPVLSFNNDIVSYSHPEALCFVEDQSETNTFEGLASLTFHIPSGLFDGPLIQYSCPTGDLNDAQ